MTNFDLPIYTMIAVMILLFISIVAIVVAVIVLFIKAIRYSGGNESLNQTFNHTNQNTFRYDPYSMDDTNGFNHCPRCNEVVTTDFHYCPKCGIELNSQSKETIIKIKTN